MKKIELLSVGKPYPTNHWNQLAEREYEKRLTGIYKFESNWAKTDAQLDSFIQESKAKKIYALDSTGIERSSLQWANELEQTWSTFGPRCAFIIGGADGYAASTQKLMREKNIEKMSFSLATFTHQFIRVILLEQIYRAHCITMGLPYHK